MKQHKQLSLSLLLLGSTKAFTVPSTRNHHHLSAPAISSSAMSSSTFLRSTSSSEDTDDEITKLKSMAAQLRAEAAALESEQQKAIADAAQKAFEKFDTNRDGTVSVAELKDGLEKAFKTELSDQRVEQLMIDLDKSGDGGLQLDEFVSVDQFRNRLDALAREEKQLAIEKAQMAQREAEVVKLLEAQVAMINDKPPTNSDKLISLLPYLFPLLDGLQFASFYVLNHPDSILAAIIAVIYGIYRSIPFGGLIAFFTLSFLSNNTRINRLIRYNMQQAIYLDIALFFPGLLTALITLVAPGVSSMPPILQEITSDALLFVLFSTLGYSVISSLLGQEPNKIPFISSAVERRLPSTSINMFDSEGKLIQWQERSDKNDDKKDGNDEQ